MGAGGQTQSVGWVFTFPIIAEKVYNQKKLSDVVKETWAKNVKEIKSNLQNKHATAHWCWQGGGLESEAKLSLWAEFSPFPVGTVAI